MSGELGFVLATAAAVGFAAGYVGSLMIVRRMALVGDALSHVALPGLAVGLLLGFDPFLGAFAFVLVAAFLTWFVERTTRLAVDAVVGVLFVFALAVGVLLTPNPDLLEALFGNLTTVGPLATVLSVGIAAVVVLLARTIYRSMILAVISEDLAVSAGVRVELVSLLYLVLVSTVVAVGVQVVGTLLVGALVIVPAAAAKVLGTNLSPYATLSAAFGVASAVVGTALSLAWNVEPGPVVVVLGVALFVAAWLFASVRKRRARAVPRAAGEVGEPRFPTTSAAPGERTS